MKRICITVVTTFIVVMMLLFISAAEVERVNIAPDAVIYAPECATNNKIIAISDGKYPIVSYQNSSDFYKYSSHAYAGGFSKLEGFDVYDNYEIISYTWDHEVTVDSIGLFFYCDMPERELWLRFGGIDAPAAYTVEYLDGDEYVSVTSGDGFGVGRDIMNITTFDAVTTRSIRITMTKLSEAERAVYVDDYVASQRMMGNIISDGVVYCGLGIGIFEFEVYEAAEKTEIEIKTDIDTDAVNDSKSEYITDMEDIIVDNDLSDEIVSTNDDEVSDTEPVESETVKPDKPETNKPVESETVKPDKPETNKPVESETVKPDKPETTEPVESETVKPDNSATTESIESETVKPDKPETTEPIESETVKPNIPETTVPDESENTDPSNGTTSLPESDDIDTSDPDIADTIVPDESETMYDDSEVLSSDERDAQSDENTSDGGASSVHINDGSAFDSNGKDGGILERIPGILYALSIIVGIAAIVATIFFVRKK